jgi:uncharacterized LabA/DUF88 family protein
MAANLVLFVDAQNMYKDAREAFFDKPGTQEYSHVYGQFHPQALGDHVAANRPYGASKEERVLKQVRIYSGAPSLSKEPRAHAAHRRQVAQWEKEGALPIIRPLRYPLDWPESRPIQKGVDVALAIDFVILALEGGFDVGVIASTDTDIKPAMEYVVSKGKPTVEVAAWLCQSQKHLSVAGARTCWHRLDRRVYDMVADYRDYNLSD